MNCLWWLLSILLLMVPSRGLVDHSSFIVRSHSRKLFDYGLFLRGINGSCTGASLSALEQSFHLYPLRTTALVVANCHRAQQRLAAAQTWEQRAEQQQQRAGGSRRQEAEDLIRRGRLAKVGQDIAAATLHVALAFQLDPQNAFAAYLWGVYLQETGDTAGAVEAYSAAVDASPSYAEPRVNAAAMYQSINDLSTAIAHYRHVLDNILVASDFGSDIFCMTKANLGVAYFQSGQSGNAIRELRELSGALAGILQTRCPEESGRFPWMHQHAVETGAAESSDGRGKDGQSCAELMSSLGVTVMHLTTIKKSICDWHHMEQDVLGFLLPSSMENYARLSAGLSVGFGPMLPFDSLLLPVTLDSRLKIAALKSAAISRAAPALVASDPAGSALARSADPPAARRQTPLILGFLSYDFNDHPTAHLIEALFEEVGDCRLEHNGQTRLMCHDVRMAMLNYGPNDNSEYRRRLQARADSVQDLPLQSHLESAQQVRAGGVDVLLDLQLHTLGNRAEIAATHPTPLLVNYLVYPGTCGSTQHDYIVADRIVVPPEHNRYYSESLLLLPPSYQISTYNHINVSVPTKQINTRDGGVVRLCNFNKIDKLDVQSLTLWMQVLRRFPRSRLQLLDPVKRSLRDASGADPNAFEQSSLAAENIRWHMMLHGVYGGRGGLPEGEAEKVSRLEIVSRMPKQGHIKRQASSDLFLDTVVYGAHSTATDALRAGLPVLTISGDSFPNRVAASLYASFESVGYCEPSIVGNETCADSDSEGTFEHRLPQEFSLSDLLVGHSQKEFEDMAVRLMSQRASLRRLGNEVAATVAAGRGVFDSRRHTMHFLHGMEAIAEVKALRGPDATGARALPHVAFTNQRLTSQN